MAKPVQILTGEPTISLLAQQNIEITGVNAMLRWLETHRPDCVPEKLQGVEAASACDLLPHGSYEDPHPPLRMTRRLTDNELLAEISGRKCYDSFIEKAGKKTNREYLSNIFERDIIHASIAYHAKMTFFFAGVSRKFSHQFIRNYVGSDRDEEGSPSQESTRYTQHYGFFVAPPYLCAQDKAHELREFTRLCQNSYDAYTAFIEREFSTNGRVTPDGELRIPTDVRKDILEAAIAHLGWSFETSFIWTTNPVAIRKFLRERCHQAADAEIYRFAKRLAQICFDTWPNLFLGADLDQVRSEVARL